MQGARALPPTQYAQSPTTITALPLPIAQESPPSPVPQPPSPPRYNLHHKGTIWTEYLHRSPACLKPDATSPVNCVAHPAESVDNLFVRLRGALLGTQGTTCCTTTFLSCASSRGDACPHLRLAHVLYMHSCMCGLMYGHRCSSLPAIRVYLCSS